MGFGNKGGADPPPQQTYDTSGAEQSMAQYMQYSSGLMASMMASQAAAVPQTQPMPESTGPEPIDWEAKKAALSEALNKGNNDASSRARGTAFTLITDPFADAEDPNVIKV